MNHLDVVAGAGLTNPITARLTERLSSGGLEDGLNCGPGCCRAAGHERRTIAGTLFSSRNTGTNEQEALLFKFLGPPNGIGIVGVTTVNDDITLLEMGDELLNKGVDSITGLDEKNDFARSLQFGSELLDGVSALDFGACQTKRPLVRS